MSYKNIFEGLKEGDLKYLVSSKFSVDEYDSKIDDDAVVVAFSLKDEEPANDFSDFIEKGGTDVLDTEVSPTIDDDGNYIVFVEFLRDTKFPRKLNFVLESISALCDITEWTYTYYGSKDEAVPYTESSIIDNVRLKSKDHKDEDEQDIEEQMNFFRSSDLDDVILNESSVVLQKNSNRMIFEKIAFGHEDIIYDGLNISTKPVLLDSKSLNECKQLRDFLGSDWDVNKIDNYFILANNSESKILVVK